MKLSEIVKIKGGWVFIDTCSLDNPIGNLMDTIGFGNPDAVAGEYETMVFLCDEKGKVSNWGELDKANYPTEAEAEKGHIEMIKKWGKNVI